MHLNIAVTIQDLVNKIIKGKYVKISKTPAGVVVKIAAPGKESE